MLVVPRPGIVESLRVRPGDLVEEGDVLGVIASDLAMKDGESLQGQIRERLLERHRELMDRIETNGRLLTLTQRHRSVQLLELRRAHEIFMTQHELVSKRARLADRQREAALRLESEGAASQRQAQDAEDLVLRLRSEENDSLARIASQEVAIRELQDELETAPLEHELEVSRIREQITDLEAQLDEASSQSRYSIRAPITGTVAVLQVAVGESVNTTQPVAILTPAKGQAEVTLLAPTRAAGFLEAGQVVGLKYAAFPFQKFGIQRATIESVGRAILSPSQLSSPVAISEPVYRVTASPARRTVRAYGREHPLHVGMLLEADVVLERRTLLDWVFEPLYRMRGM